jgi:bifunctional DNase/RNase
VLSIDARPSDSVAVALRAKAPIFVNEQLLQEPPKEGEAETAEAGEGGEEPPRRALTDEEKAEQLRRYLEDMDPEDFGKFSM